MAHLDKAPGRGVGPTHGGGPATQTMDFKTTPPNQEYGPSAVQTETPVNVGTPVPDALARQQMGTESNVPPTVTVPPSKTFGMAPTPQEQNPALFPKKSIKKSQAYILDSMLLKALGVRYATKEYSKTT